MASGADWLALLPGGWVPGWQVVCLLLLAGNALFIGRNILLVTACQQRDQTLWLSPLLLISGLLAGFLGWASFSTISAWEFSAAFAEESNLP